jgi:hypothetical protein
MAFHVVTDRCFLVCEKVTSVVIEEVEQVRPVKRKRKPRKPGKRVIKPAPPPPPVWFNIKISYYPVTNPRQSQYNNQNPLEEFELNLSVEGKDEATKLYRRIIKEVQEQHPNEGYLDKLMDDLLTGENVQVGDPHVVNR